MTREEAIDILSDNHTVLYSHGDYTEQEENEALSMAIKSLEKQEDFIKILFEIQEAVWGIDIPSPTVPEYREHHEQCQELLALLDKKIKEVEEG